jgi:radical SAM superfamily enzyme YgiQ (UPF0313 family)
MKITYIFPPLGHAGEKVRSMPLVPPVLEHMAGLTSALKPEWEIRLINANVESFVPEELTTDIAGISILTHQSSWAYALADRLRQRGIRVMLGGPHPTALPEEASAHADAVVVGEAEGVLGELFGDLEAGSLKRRYEGMFLPLDNMPFPRRDLLSGYTFHSFHTSRGCPYTCRFCTTPMQHGAAMRYRPVREVIADIASFYHRMWFCTDADIWGPDVDRYTELFREMAVSLPGIYWVGEAGVSSVQHPRGGEMLKWARRSGLMQVWIGWESFSEQILAEYGAQSKMKSQREDALKRIRDNGIDVGLFLMLGSQDESLREYDQVLELCDRLTITPHPVMVVPYPGTALYEELKGEVTGNWDFYDGMHCILPQQNGPGEHEAALKKIWGDLFTFKRILRRLAHVSPKGFPSAHIASGIVQFALRKAFLEFTNIKPAGR